MFPQSRRSAPDLVKNSRSWTAGRTGECTGVLTNETTLAILPSFGDRFHLDRPRTSVGLAGEHSHFNDKDLSRPGLDSNYWDRVKPEIDIQPVSQHIGTPSFEVEIRTPRIADPHDVVTTAIRSRKLEAEQIDRPTTGLRPYRSRSAGSMRSA